jgi:acetyl esterase/lipase
MQIPAFLTRHALSPTLRMVRDRLAADPDYLELRKWAARADRSYPSTALAARTSEVAIGAINATWIDAKGAHRDRVILYLHGGAFIIETPGIHARLAARIGAQARSRALMPSYRLAPEFPCPAALDDCFAAYRFLLDNGFAAANIAIAGDSAGGNLALGLLLRARDEGLPLPACAVVMSPVTDALLSGDSLRRNEGHDAMFAPSLFHAMLPLYLPDPTLRSHPHVSPLHADLEGLPPILMLVGSTELLLDDSVRFASKCRSATLEVWHDMPHVFPLFDFLPEATDATQRIGRFVRDCLDASRSPTDETAPVASQATDVGDDPGRGATTRAPQLRAPGAVSAAAAITARAWLYLALALIAAVAAIVPMIIGPAAPGIAPGGLLAGFLPGAAFPGIEAWLGTAALAVFAQAGVNRMGRRRAALPVLVGLLLGVASGLALLLFERERAPGKPP